MNEEEIRGKILLPFLNDLGIGLSEISLEKSFSVRLGKSNHTIKGRSDILCKRNNKNLFIIELKNDSISISQDDIDQGISYARLLADNIAPFTIITNGKTTRIFDSISRDELTGTKISKQSGYWKNECTLSMDVDLRIRYEALKNFVSFSPENLKFFCKHQVQDRMGPIVGDINNPYSKFVKELYVQRKDLQSTFDDFVSSKNSIFAIVGTAGVGKTNAMCALALHKLKDEFVFFYNAALINKSPLEHITYDLNGVFSGKSEGDTVLKKLDDLGRYLKKSILIFIDAIDESSYSTLALELSEIALAVRTLEKVKICISCKSNIWKNIVKKNETPTHLFEELKRVHNVIPSVDSCPGYLLEDFGDDEIVDVVNLYKEVFGFKGPISESILRVLRNGFFLRIFSEVYSNREIPKEINDKELIKKYIYQSLEKTNIGSQFGLRILSRIGKIFISHQFNTLDRFYDEGLEAESLVEKLEFPLEETIPEDLFARNILIRSNKEGSYNISFYYSKIRDYIICFHSYKLDKLPDNEFYESLDLFYENYVGQSAISFYTENASYEHQQILTKFKEDKSLKYVNSYNDFLEKYFKKFKEKFDPHTSGDIGILLSEDLLQNSKYGLFPLNSSTQKKVQQVRLGSPFSDSFYDNPFFQKGVKIIHGSIESLLIRNQSKAIRQDIFNQLKEIIYKGRLSVYNSDAILLEQLATILYFYSRQLGYDFELHDYNLPRFDLIYPIDLKSLRARIYQFRVTEYYKRQRIDVRLRAELIDRALLENIDIPRLNITGDFPPFEELYIITEKLLDRGYSVITEHFLPCPDISIDETKKLTERTSDTRDIRAKQFSKGQAKIYIERFFRHFESCYKDFVEYFFPRFKDKFPFYMNMPHEYFIYMKDLDVHKWGYLGYRTSKSKDVKVNFKKLTQGDEPFTLGETDILRAFYFDKILHNDYFDLIKTIDKINTPKVDEYCVLRTWVYKFLKGDMRTLLKENEE